MARPGVTYQDVANAAQEITAKGINPTIETVRHLLGTGSSTTIALHLKAWKVKQTDAQHFLGKEKLPDELVATLKGLWSQIVAQAEDKVEEIKQNSEAEINGLKDQVTNLTQQLNGYERETAKLTNERNNLLNDKATLEQGTIELQKQTALLTSQADALNKQIGEKNDRISELNRLHTQAQANLEHYRNSTREQRLLEQQRFEQQKQELEQTIIQLQQKLSRNAQEIKDLHQKADHLLFENKSYITELKETKSGLKQLQVDFSKAEKERIELKQMQQHWEQQCKHLQLQVDTSNSTLLEKEKHLATAKQKAEVTLQQLQEATDQNKQIALQKWELAQEKASLEGQLKQLQLMMDKTLKLKATA